MFKESVAVGVHLAMMSHASQLTAMSDFTVTVDNYVVVMLVGKRSL